MIQVWNNVINQKEVENVTNAIHDKYIMEGPVLREFEEHVKKLLGVDYVIGTSSGSAALTLSLMGIGIKPGDEVIVPDLTFIATANAPCLVGAQVILAPTQKNYPLIDWEAVDDLITDRTKAIITVDLNGRIAASKELKKKYHNKGIYIIDDACQAFTSESDDGKAGTQADIGCFSFGITKTVSTVMGGAVATNNQKLYEKMKIMKTQGMISVFEGDSHHYPGFNFKLPDVLAAVGLGQLERLDEKRKHMETIDKMYRDALADVEGIDFLPKKANEFSWMPDIVCKDRNRVRWVLKENEIISRPLGAPLHTAPYLKGNADYRFAEEMQKRMLSLPGGPDQPFENVERVIEVLKNSKLC